MSNKHSIQLHIPTPCQEDWQAMTPCEQGRFCGSCQKTVMDFTSWSDKALYDFFSKNTAPVCGRIFEGQLSRDIRILPQPLSKLYRIAIACGLTLMFTYAPQAHANVKALTEYTEPLPDDKDATGSIEGTVTDENGEPAVGAQVNILKSGKKHLSLVADMDGLYKATPISPGIYDLVVEYPNYKKVTISKITVGRSESAVVNVSLNPNILEEVTITYVKPLIITNNRPNFSREDARIRMGDFNPIVPLDKDPAFNATQHRNINNGGSRANNTITTLEMIKEDPSTNKKKKGFFSFLKRKKKSNEQ